MTNTSDLLVQWQAAERAYRQERERYFPIHHQAGTDGREMQPDDVEGPTSEVFERLEMLRDEAERLHGEWLKAGYVE